MSSVALAFFFFCMLPVQAEPLRVAVVLSEEGGVYQEFSDLLRVKMPVAKFALNTVGVDQAIAASDLYIAVGMKAANELASRDIPVLNVLVPKAGYDKLPNGSAKRTVPRSAVFLDQPMERQVAFLLAALPSTRHVGVLYSTPPQELPNARRLLADKNVRLHDRSVGEAQSLNDALESILGESEVLFVLADAGVYNAGTIRNILLTSYRKQIPLVGISQAYVKAGALCAIYSTPDQIAAQAAEAVRLFSETGKLPPSQYPREFEVSVNMQVARSLDIRIEDSARLRDEIRRVP
ncbi:MAG: ABC transporter substrate binding protein [Sideroxyarcus sp.]